MESYLTKLSLPSNVALRSNFLHPRHGLRLNKFIQAATATTATRVCGHIVHSSLRRTTLSPNTHSYTHMLYSHIRLRYTSHTDVVIIFMTIPHVSFCIREMPLSG